MVCSVLRPAQPEPPGARPWRPGSGHRAPPGSLAPSSPLLQTLPARNVFLFFSFSQPDQPPEGMIRRCSSNPSCLAVRMYLCRQQRDKIIRRGSKFRESSYPSSRTWAGLLGREGLWASSSCWGVGRGGPAVRETRRSYHPVWRWRTGSLLAQGRAPSPRPGAPQHRGQRRRLPRAGTREKPAELGRCGQGRAGEARGLCAWFWESGWGLWGAWGRRVQGWGWLACGGTARRVGGRSGAHRAWGTEGRRGLRGGGPRAEPGLLGVVAPRCLAGVRWAGVRVGRPHTSTCSRGCAHTRKQSVPKFHSIKLNTSLQELEEACVL